MERLYGDVAVHQGDLDQLIRITAAYITREHFLTEMTLGPPELTSDKSGDPYHDKGYLVLSTIHSPKDQKWKTVYVLNAANSYMPADLDAGSHRELKGERRLLHVTVTYVHKHLDVLVPQHFYITQQAPSGDRHIYVSRTHFTPFVLLPLFETCIWSELEPDTDPAAKVRVAAKVDLSKEIHGYWKK